MAVSNCQVCDVVFLQVLEKSRQWEQYAGKELQPGSSPAAQAPARLLKLQRKSERLPPTPPSLAAQASREETKTRSNPSSTGKSWA